MEFEWDIGNSGKNLKSHGIFDQEAEESFSDDRKIQATDVTHSTKEKRYVLIGKTKKRRLLYIAYTMRNKRIRIISARDINRKERKFYEKTP